MSPVHFMPTPCPLRVHTLPHTPTVNVDIHIASVAGPTGGFAAPVGVPGWSSTRH
jgi:hypothetical protein